MSFSLDGLNAKIKKSEITIKVKASHPLIMLANEIPWDELWTVAAEDLKGSTAKGFWNRGRKLYIRPHLGILLLQAVTKKTDRAIISELQENAAYQLFCGITVMDQWQIPHPTKVEEFRSRLSPPTKAKINEVIVKKAVSCGLADPSVIDIDSTVQEANISYPTDASNLLKLAKKAAQIADGLRLEVKVNLKKISALARGYFFRGKCSKEAGDAALTRYFNLVKAEILPIITIAEDRIRTGAIKVKWNLKRAINQVGQHGRQYLKDAGFYVKNHRARVGKRLSFHAGEVACISKGKAGKPHEFGRVVQLMRTGGNFLLALCNNQVNLSDKKAIRPLLELHSKVFGEEKIKSLATDRGYFSEENVKLANKAGVEEIGIQKSGVVSKLSVEEVRLRNRRAGIEPLIGHVKKFGLARSKMKSDANTHGSGFTAILGYNCSQWMRKIKPKRLKMAA